MTEFGCHWYAFTTRADRLAVEMLLAFLLSPRAANWQEVFVEQDRGGVGYARAAFGPYGARLYWSDGREDMHVVLPGQACEVLGLTGIMSLWNSDVQQHPTRIDLAFDGVVGPDGQQLSPTWLRDVIEKDHRQVRTWANIRPQDHKPRGERSESWKYECGPNGETCYIGSANSERRICVYTKRGFTRLELRLKGKRAAWALDCFADKPPERIVNTGLNILRTFINFVDKDTEEYQPWWSAFVGEKVTVKEFPRKLPSAPERTAKWLVHGVARSLAALESHAPGFTSMLSRYGRMAMNARGKALISIGGGKGKGVAAELFAAARGAVSQAIGITIQHIQEAANSMQVSA